ncbi:uncharacterized protein LOC122996066 isoform X2 [Thunnus albacares]|uniref:uncharacterized protein LOC122996066 isoform X2 n=1 Tax=Thunnus albacares TaxID=8236 RepID=UPI001CF62AB1|nr:uncharacterized protein LOC122996066 isoform X2 [Thunnus albacares]
MNMMSTKFEHKWNTSLTSILLELDESEYKRMLFNLNNIPKGLKTSKSREEMPQIIIQYYGLEQSVFAIKKVMNLIPRRDAAVQDLLRPFVEQLKKIQQTKNKDKKPSSKPNKTGPGKPVKSKQKMTGTQSKGTKVTPKTTKVRSDDVQIGRITITGIIKSMKTKFHLEAEFNNKQQTFVVTSRLLAKAFGFKLEDDFKERLLDLMPVSTDAKIQENKITEMKNM